MANYNYGGKIGIYSVIKFTKLLCRIYVKFLTPIRDYINTHPTLTLEQKVQIIMWLDTAADVCYLLESQVEFVYEPVA